jgi:hypothetical protein
LGALQNHWLMSASPLNRASLVVFHFEVIKSRNVLYVGSPFTKWAAQSDQLRPAGWRHVSVWLPSRHWPVALAVASWRRATQSRLTFSGRRSLMVENQNACAAARPHVCAASASPAPSSALNAGKEASAGEGTRAHDHHPSHTHTRLGLVRQPRPVSIHGWLRDGTQTDNAAEPRRRRRARVRSFYA